MKLVNGYTQNEIKVFAALNRPKFIKLWNNCAYEDELNGIIKITGYDDEGKAIYERCEAVKTTS